MKHITPGAGRIAWRLALMFITFLAGAFLVALVSALGEASVPSTVEGKVRLVAPAPATADSEMPPPTPPAPETSTPVPEIAPLVVSKNRLLLTDAASSRLYMLDGEGRVVWQWSGESISVEPFIINQPVVVGDTIHVFGRDMIHATLDAATGRQRSGGGSYGSGEFTQATKYKDEFCLVVLDVKGRHESAAGTFLQVYKGQEMYWQDEFPRGAQLRLWRGKIYAVTFGAVGVEMKEIAEPEMDTEKCCC
ncbi:MAG TPA: hypothetical protein VGB73_16515 [Pyrinomonadaceae bacterium]